MSNISNYREQGGDSWKVGGTLEILTDGKIKIGASELTGASTLTLAAGTKADKIDDPTGGTTTDTEARAAIAFIINALEGFGISNES